LPCRDDPMPYVLMFFALLLLTLLATCVLA
jgi:hypothetical protein